MSSFTRRYRYKLRLDGAQKTFLLTEMYACKKAYNLLLEKSIKDFKDYQEGIITDRPSQTGFTFARQLPALKKDYPYLSEVSSVGLQQAAIDLGTAYDGFFRRLKGTGTPGFPKFKNRYSKLSVRMVNFTINFKLVPVKYPDKKGLTLALTYPKCKTPLRILWDRPLPSDPTSVTISRDACGDFYASFVCERETLRDSGKGEIGIDLGLNTLVTTSAGETTVPPKTFRQYEKKLKRVQQQLAKKKKAHKAKLKSLKQSGTEITSEHLRKSNNYLKQQHKVAKIHRKIANTRNDFTHKLTSKLINDNQVIGMELLNVSGMKRGLKLGKSVSDACLGQIRQQLLYKAEESQNCRVILYPTFLASTQVCSQCFYFLEKTEKLALKDREWTCPKCNTNHDRDINAAKVIYQAAKLSLRSIPPVLLEDKRAILLDPENTRTLLTSCSA